MTRHRGRTRIVISTDIQLVVDQAQAALLALPGPQIYQRGGILVRVTREGCEVPGLTRPPGVPRITDVPDPYLMELMARAADWFRADRSTRSRIPALPPPWAVKALQARGEWPFPPLEGVSES